MVKAWPLLTFQFHKAHFSPPCLSPILLSTSSYASQTEDTHLQCYFLQREKEEQVGMEQNSS